jgi:L-ascorbate metabolism protein UlaG (beta-lactamase superfamily)
VFFRQVLYRDLGCASYVVGDGGEAIVLDPRFDIDIYLDIAREEGLRISHVVDTHDHADHVSGRSRLVAATGAIAHRPARPQEPREEDLEPGDELKVGDVRVRALATGIAPSTSSSRLSTTPARPSPGWCSPATPSWSAISPARTSRSSRTSGRVTCTPACGRCSG